MIEALFQIPTPTPITAETILRDPAWQAVGVIIAIILGMVTIWLARRPRKALTYKILSSTPLIASPEAARGKLQILFDGKPIEDVKLVLVKFTNSGNLPITSSDYESPVKLIVVSRLNVARLLDAGVSETYPEGLAKNVSVLFDKSAVQLEPLLLNQGDSITLKMLITNFTMKEGVLKSLADNISVEGRIVGVKEIKDSMKANPTRIALYMLASMGIAAISYFAMKWSSSYLKVGFGAITLLALASSLYFYFRSQWAELE